MGTSCVFVFTDFPDIPNIVKNPFNMEYWKIHIFLSISRIFTHNYYYIFMLKI